VPTDDVREVRLLLLSNSEDGRRGLSAGETDSEHDDPLRDCIARALKSETSLKIPRDTKDALLPLRFWSISRVPLKGEDAPELLLGEVEMIELFDMRRLRKRESDDADKGDGQNSSRRLGSMKLRDDLLLCSLYPCGEMLSEQGRVCSKVFCSLYRSGVCSRERMVSDTENVLLSQSFGLSQPRRVFVHSGVCTFVTTDAAGLTVVMLSPYRTMVRSMNTIVPV
jgi:hypothetical protein